MDQRKNGPVSPKRELQRLRSGPRPGETPGASGLDRIAVRSEGNAAEVIAQCKEVLTSVLMYGAETWPSLASWEQILPGWFVRQFAPRESTADAERWLTWWRELPPAERAKAQEERRWTLEDWIGWLRPGEREWWWWDARVTGEQSAIVEVEVDDWPHATGALRWLLRASGATAITSEG